MKERGGCDDTLRVLLAYSGIVDPELFGLFLLPLFCRPSHAFHRAV